MSAVRRVTAVAAPHPAAVAAAAAAVRRGGNAIDAALAAAAVLTVVYPHQCALGGDLIALVRVPGQDGATAVLSVGAQPAGLDIDALAGAPMPRRGIHTVTVPGVVAGWSALAGLGAELPLGDALTEAAVLARDGTEVSEGLARGLAGQRSTVLADPGLRAVFAPTGEIAGLGDVIRQPALAATLSELAADPGSFYRGQVAARVAAGLAALGGDHTTADLAAHRPEVVPALERLCGAARWWAAPPPSQGALLLGVLPSALAAGRAVAEADPLVAECVRAMAVRDRELGDPRGGPIDVEAMINLAAADGAGSPPSGRALGDTVAISAVDTDGRAICLIQSVFQTFGAGLLEPGTGIVLHNRGAAYSTEPRSPGALRPGSRPPHTLCPAIVSGAGRLVALGCQGGRAQPWILAQVAADLVTGEVPAAQVLARPRWVVGARDLGHDRTVLLAEPGTARAVAAAAALAIAVIEAEGPVDEAGHVQVAVLDTARGLPHSATDPRADGRAAVIEGPLPRARSAPRGQPPRHRAPRAGIAPGRQRLQTMSITHWTDPLTHAEIAEVVALVRADPRIGERPRFWGIAVEEGLARALAPGQGRPVRLVVMNPDAHAAWEVGAWTSGRGLAASIASWAPVDSKRPGVSSEEARMAAAACRADPAFQEALAKRGIDDASLVWVDPESIAGFEPADLAARRLCWGTVWHREAEDDNGYARPVAGLIPIIDLETLEVLRIEDHGVVPLAAEGGNYRPGTWGTDRTVAPLEIIQPEGPGFTIDGQLVTWQNWSFRVGFTHREGLVLHDVVYHEGDEPRPVLKRAAVNEMYVPYLDSDPTAYRKNFFDWGEYGAGPLTASLELGCDCLGEIRYLDAAVLNGHGEPRTISNAICLHEEDFSVLWKHVNTRTGEAAVRRARRLVISSFATVANYDYGFYWSFYQDGMIDLEVKLTGILSVSGIEDGRTPAYGRLVSPNVQAPNHQHYFGVRLDMGVDGPLNRLYEVHAEIETDEALNPYGNACKMVKALVPSEAAAARTTDPSRAVHWLVESSTRVNQFGDHTGYRVTLPSTTRLFARPGSIAARKAPFVAKHLWATAYDPAERFIAGEYPNQAPLGEDGVQAWQRANRSLDGAELVLWPVVGVHHDPRPEEWPVMPVHRIGLRLEPDGFFARNPSLDVPAPKAHAAGGHDSACSH